MGISRQLLVDEPHSDCICPVCQDVLEEPRETSCQHAFCHECISRWLQEHDTCPTCRTPMNRLHMKPLHRIWREKLYRLRVRCGRSNDGCAAVMELSRRHAHSQSCEFVHVPCPNRPCSQTMARGRLREHLELCDHRLVRCEQGCGLFVSARLEKTHSCVGALKLELEAVNERVETVQKECSRLDRLMRKEREIRSSLEKVSQDQSLAIRELFEQLTGMKEEMAKDTKKVRMTSLPRLAPLHTHMSIGRRYNGKLGQLMFNSEPEAVNSMCPCCREQIWTVSIAFSCCNSVSFSCYDSISFSCYDTTKARDKASYKKSAWS